MPRLVHITAENIAKKIRKNGISAARFVPSAHEYPRHDRVVWAFPILPSYTLTHSWSREVKRWGRSSLVAVQFRVEDEEEVYVGHYASESVLMTASQAVSLVQGQEDPRGYEIMVPHRIDARDIMRIRSLPRAIGWRYWPTARGEPMKLCECSICMPRGEVKASRYRNRLIARIDFEKQGSSHS